MTNSTPIRNRQGLRRAAASIAAVTALSGLAACSSESAGPEEGVTTSDLQQLEADLGALDERVTAVEGEMDDMGAADAGALDEDADYDFDTFYDERDALLNETVTVSAAVSEVWTEDGAAFRIGGDSGEPIPVISANPAAGLALEDVVRVTGKVTTIQQDTFEEDFGIAADGLFDDPDAFWADWEGEIALAASEVEVIDESAEEDDDDA